MAITWNVVNRTGEPADAIADKLRERIEIFESLVAHLPEGTVRMEVALAPRDDDRSYPVTLRLRVDSDILEVTRKGRTLSGAVDEAIGELGARLGAEAKARLDPARSRQRSDAATRTRSEFDALLIAMQRLESSLASAAPYRQEAWTTQVRDDFRAVYSALERHGSSAESEDGLFTEIRLTRPEMERRIEELVRSQRELMDLAAELEASIAEGSDTSDFSSVRKKAADLLLMIRHQHAREVDLVYETFWQDLGGSE